MPDTDILPPENLFDEGREVLVIGYGIGCLGLCVLTCLFFVWIFFQGDGHEGKWCCRSDNDGCLSFEKRPPARKQPQIIIGAPPKLSNIVTPQVATQRGVHEAPQRAVTLKASAPPPLSVDVPVDTTLETPTPTFTSNNAALEVTTDIGGTNTESDNQTSV